jgi:hypothetical protein
MRAEGRDSADTGDGNLAMSGEIGTSFAKTPAAPEPAVADLEGCRAELARFRSELEEAVARMADVAGSSHHFDRARRRRDKLAGEVERLVLRERVLEREVEAARSRDRTERIAAMKIEAAELEATVARLEGEGVEMARVMAAVVRRIEAARTRALDLSTRIDPRQIYPTGPEPSRLYEALAGCLNVARKCCPFTKPGLDAERQLSLPQEIENHGDQAA